MAALAAACAAGPRQVAPELFAVVPAPAPPAPVVPPAIGQPRLALEFTTLRIMLNKGIITQAEFDALKAKALA